ncbi:unnamed protein product [Calypogeia fissa]
MAQTCWLLLVVSLLIVGLQAVSATGGRPGVPQGLEQGLAFGSGLDLEDLNVKWVRVHAWLMWSSFGFLFPLGVILIRFNRSQRDPTRGFVSSGRARICYYVHIIVQCSAVCLATAGVFTLVKAIGAKFSITHTRLGWSLWMLIVLMPVIGIVRPTKGQPSRPYWYFIHWLIGTGAVVLGFVNIYIGISLYQFFIKPIRSLDIAFSVQVALMGLVYFLQGQWSYILSQRLKPGKDGEQEGRALHPLASQTA